MRREHSVRAVDWRVAMRMAGAIVEVKSAAERRRQQASVQFVICPMQSTCSVDLPWLRRDHVRVAGECWALGFQDVGRIHELLGWAPLYPEVESAMTRTSHKNDHFRYTCMPPIGLRENQHTSGT